MKNKNYFLDFIIYDVLAKVSNLSHKAMFGGFGLYKNGVIFGIIAKDELYFKVDSCNIDDFKKLNSKPLTYAKNGRQTSISYWLVPEDILENREIISKLVAGAVKAKTKA